MYLRAVCVPARRATPHGGVRIDLAEFIADRKRGRVGQVSVNHAIDELFFGAIALYEAVVILPARDQPATNIAGVTERSRDIGHVTLLIPAAVTGGDGAAELFAVGVFAHHIDGS